MDERLGSSLHRSQRHVIVAQLIDGARQADAGFAAQVVATRGLQRCQRRLRHDEHLSVLPVSIHSLCCTKAVDASGQREQQPVDARVRAAEGESVQDIERVEAAALLPCVPNTRS